jgi:hypothetical protein
MLVLQPPARISPLRIAALKGRVDTVRVLLSCGSDIEATDGQGLTALEDGRAHACCFTIRGNDEKWQPERAARLSDALGFAINRHDLEQCKKLVMNGASLFEQYSRETQLTPFLQAPYKRELPIASYFLERGSSCNGITPNHPPEILVRGKFRYHQL